MVLFRLRCIDFCRHLLANKWQGDGRKTWPKSPPFVLRNVLEVSGTPGVALRPEPSAAWKVWGPPLAAAVLATLCTSKLMRA